MRILGSLGVIAALATVGHADGGVDKTDAKALLASGLKLYAAKDYLGALTIFRDAYLRFPSAKLQLNIATTLVKLDKKPEAANAYQKYLDADDADPAKKPEVMRVLAELDKAVATLAITVTPADTELKIGDDEYAKNIAIYRVVPGDAVIRARHEGYSPVETTVHGALGTSTPVAIVLFAIPKKPPPPVPVIPIEKHVESPRSRFGALALAHVDIQNRGAAALIGATADVIDRVQLQATALIGPKFGGYVGGDLAILTGRVRPLISVGMPVFVSNGPRFAVRGAVGVELVLDRHLSVIAEVGFEHVFAPEMDVIANLVIPALGVAGRL